MTTAAGSVLTMTRCPAIFTYLISFNSHNSLLLFLSGKLGKRLRKVKVTFARSSAGM